MGTPDARAAVAPRISLSNRVTPRLDARTLGELLIDREEDRVLRAVFVGMLGEADRNRLPMMK
jgi:hypothetical protein